VASVGLASRSLEGNIFDFGLPKAKMRSRPPGLPLSL
jgi:hypothetical protein